MTNWIIGYFLVTLLVPLVMLIIVYTVSRLIPIRYVKWYTNKKDGLFDLIAALFGMIMSYYLLLAVGSSLYHNGSIQISAVELGEAQVEIVVLSGILLILLNHSVIQLRLIMDRRVNK